MSWTDPDDAIPPGNLEIVHEFPYSSLADPESYEVEGRRMCVRWLSHKQIKEWPDHYSMTIETSNGTVRVVLQNTRPVPAFIEEETTQPYFAEHRMSFQIGDKVLWEEEEYVVTGKDLPSHTYSLQRGVRSASFVPAEELTCVY